jgi:hypothetical protein
LVAVVLEVVALLVQSLVLEVVEVVVRLYL